MRRSRLPGARETTLGLAAAFAALGSTAATVHAQRRDALQAAVTAAPVGVEDTVATATLRAVSLTLTPGRPMSNSGRHALQWLAGSAGAVAGGIAVFFLLRDVSDQRVNGDDSYTRSGNVGWLIGSFAGVTTGAHLVGNRLGGTSPLWATALGAAIGTIPVASLGLDEPWLPVWGLVFGWIPQGAAATAGYIMAESATPATPSPR